MTDPIRFAVTATEYGQCAHVIAETSHGDIDQAAIMLGPDGGAWVNCEHLIGAWYVMRHASIQGTLDKTVYPQRYYLAGTPQQASAANYYYHDFHAYLIIHPDGSCTWQRPVRAVHMAACYPDSPKYRQLAATEDTHA